MELLLINLVDYLAEAMPELLLVDEDYGQLENLEDEERQMYPLVYPAVLIEPSRVDWSHIAGRSQKGEATLRVRLIIDCYDDTHSGSGTRERIREREALRHRLHSLLEGYRPLGDGALMRSQSTFYTYRHGIKVYESLYSCTMTESLREGRGRTNTPIRPSLHLERL